VPLEEIYKTIDNLVHSVLYYVNNSTDCSKHSCEVDAVLATVHRKVVALNYHTFFLYSISVCQ